MKEIKIEVTVGRPDGHYPGNNYWDVIVEITRSVKGWWSVKVTDVWGSDQGYEEEHGRKEVVGEASTLQEAVAEAKDYAREAEIEMKFGSQALSQAAHKARLAEEAAEEEGAD